MTVNTAVPGPEVNVLQTNAVQGSGRKRNRFRKILITLLILFTTGLGALWWSMRPLNKDLQEIAHIEKLGGVVTREYPIPNNILSLIPTRLRDYIPMMKVRVIGIRGPKPTDEDLMGTFSHFQDLEFISLPGTRVTDRIMEVISRQPHLKILSVWGTSITDEGLTHLNRNRTIIHLSLDGTKITDRGVEEISQMTQIQSLTLSKTNVTDASVDFLLKMRNLRELYIEGTEISEEGIARLKKKERLKILQSPTKK